MARSPAPAAKPSKHPRRRREPAAEVPRRDPDPVAPAAPGHGGKREGAGRKPERLPDELLTKLGEPPEDPLAKTAWWNRLIEILQWGVIQGKPWVTMLRDASRNATVASKLVPEEIKAAAAKILEQEDRETNEDAAPRPTPREGDPIARANAGAIRRDPS